MDERKGQVSSGVELAVRERGCLHVRKLTQSMFCEGWIHRY